MLLKADSEPLTGPLSHDSLCGETRTPARTPAKASREWMGKSSMKKRKKVQKWLKRGAKPPRIIIIHGSMQVLTIILSEQNGTSTWMKVYEHKSTQEQRLITPVEDIPYHSLIRAQVPLGVTIDCT